MGIGQSEDALLDDAELRKQATRQVWVCPGSGFALIGNRSGALGSLIITLGLMPVAIWATFQPSKVSIGPAVVLLVLSTAIWIAEFWAVKFAKVRSPNPAWLARRYALTGCILLLSILVVILLFFTSFGSLRMVGDAMSPTLNSGERLLYHKHIEWSLVKPGRIIVYKNGEDSGWGESGWLITARILAEPGDELSIQDGHYRVNNEQGPLVAGTGKYEVAIDIPASPASLTVPEDCYFMVQDLPSGSLDSRVLSWAHKENILGVRLWHFFSGGILLAVQE